MSRRSLLAAGGAALTLALAACSGEDDLAKQATAGDNKGYISGNGAVNEYPVDKRKEPLDFAGKLFDGSAVNAADYRGAPAVINFWYAACAPCRKEAKDLQALYAEFKDRDVKFLGINVRDEQATAESFDRKFGITYPSVIDKEGGVQLAISKTISLEATPITLVLDKAGRISARIVGQLEKGTLKALITTVLEEK